MGNKKYGLFVAISMIIGIVIGSGIFFKSGDILKYTNGNIALGVVVFIIGAISIIFGSLTISSLSSICDEPGGFIGYANKFCGKNIASAFGWFNTFVYYPALCAVLSWVSGVYICMIFGIKSTIELEMFVGFFCLAAMYILNILSAKFAGIFQGAATIIKLIPLVLIAILGLLFGDHTAIISGKNEVFASTSWLVALAPMAFAFDGWIVSTTIGNEIKNSKRNLPIALIISPLVILVVYIAYFVGITSYVGPEKVIELGNNHVQYAANLMFGAWGAKAIVVFVIISVLGTLNGMVLGSIRMPYSLALRGLFPKSESVSKMNDKLSIPLVSSLVSVVLSIFWYFAHYITTKYNILGGGDISEIAVVTNYMLFIFLYVAVIRLAKSGELKCVFRGYISPFLAILGSLVIFFGSLFMNNFVFYILFSLFILIIGYFYSVFVSKKLTSDNVKKFD